MSGPSPVYPIIETFVRDEFARLDAAQITPWAFFHAGQFRVGNFRGEPISYSGIRFYGSPVHVFWNGYIEPFLEDISYRAIDLSMRAAADRNVPLRQPLLEAQGQLHSLCCRTFERMATIDQRLRSHGSLDVVPLRRTENELARMRQFIDKRIDAELRAIKTPGRMQRLNHWFRDNPALVKGMSAMIAAALAIITLILKMRGHS
ncbi:MAG TPA: hypothetical protein VHZ53_06000 [Steroidobacteraceae bacterium]|jgi:hypothetical protein|nr:hypothetical protein [Steroidobacteraceae bacterium]